MTEQQQRASAELARRIGWREGEFAGIWFPPDGNLKRVQADPPDYFTDPAASRELVVWLAKQGAFQVGDNLREGFKVRAEFVYHLTGWRDGYNKNNILYAMTAEPSVIARAACKALGIELTETHSLPPSP